MTLNRKAFLALIQATREADPEQFDMADVVHACGTPACVFGQYAARTDLQTFVTISIEPDGEPWTRDVSSGDYCSPFGESTREHFGISVLDIETLFNATGCDCARTPAEAVEFLEGFYAERCAEEEGRSL